MDERACGSQIFQDGTGLPDPGSRGGLVQTGCRAPGHCDTAFPEAHDETAVGSPGGCSSSGCHCLPGLLIASTPKLVQGARRTDIRPDESPFAGRSGACRPGRVPGQVETSRFAFQSVPPVVNGSSQLPAGCLLCRTSTGKQRGSSGYSEPAECRTGRGGDVGESFEELVEGGLAVVDGSAFVVGEGDVGRHLCRLSFASRNWPLLDAFELNVPVSGRRRR